ncbi:MAG TPA: hypothetical protein VHH10_09310, partial [Rubrobacteraceae bacterium]|nr:hypothetical protein [Rubrobacteraceae bacterium]
GVARDIVEKAYERRDEAKQMDQQGDTSPGSASTSSSSPGDTGATGTTTIGDEDRPSARPLRRDE